MPVGATAGSLESPAEQPPRRGGRRPERAKQTPGSAEATSEQRKGLESHSGLTQPDPPAARHCKGTPAASPRQSPRRHPKPCRSSAIAAVTAPRAPRLQPAPRGPCWPPSARRRGGPRRAADGEHPPSASTGGSRRPFADEAEASFNGLHRTCGTTTIGVSQSHNRPVDRCHGTVRAMTGTAARANRRRTRGRGRRRL